MVRRRDAQSNSPRGRRVPTRRRGPAAARAPPSRIGQPARRRGPLARRPVAAPSPAISASGRTAGTGRRPRAPPAAPRRGRDRCRPSRRRQAVRPARATAGRRRCAALALPGAHDRRSRAARVVVVGVRGVDEVVEDEPRRRWRRPAASGGGPARPASRRRRRVEPVVAEHDVRQLAQAVALERVEVVREVEAAGLAGLRRDVARVDTTSAPDASIASADPGHEQHRQDAREQGARAEDDQLGLGDRARARRRSGGTSSGRDPDPVDAVGLRDPALAVDLGAVVEPRVEGQRRRRRGHHPAAHREHPVHLAHAPPRSRRPRASTSAASSRLPTACPPRLDGASPVARRRRVAHGGAATPGKRYWRSSAHERLGVGERHDAVADVAHGGMPSSVAEHARTSRRRRPRSRPP